MRPAFITVSATTLIAAVALLGTFATRSHADPPLPYHRYAPNLASDSATGSIPSSPSPEPPAEFLLQGGCVETPASPYQIVGYEIQSTPGNFFYSHAYATQQNEPFTHTGVLSTYLDIPAGSALPAGWTQGWDAPIVDGRADIFTRLPGVPGTYTIEIVPGPNQVAQGSPVTFNAPGDCIPLDLNTWIPPAHDLHFPLDGLAGLSVTGGTCLGFTTNLEITIAPDGTLTFFQPDTLDTNTGNLWPAPGGGFEFVVTNHQHPEAYAGVISPDLTHISGWTAWNNACLWAFDAIVTY